MKHYKSVEFLSIFQNVKPPAQTQCSPTENFLATVLDQTTLWNLSTLKTEQNEVHVPTANDGEHLSALITFKFSAKITHTPGILTTGDFHIDRSGGRMVPR